ncbi:PadR family transcriptional regulator [Erwiniaceae bacterium BAC15a-03b]|uniref:PadR family transcriptional regulator n=1 Tax=Winslowiella arboricola TaxID=2978220 RepID=A0A9J6PVG5_9GAMM|nr:PadR family transcriptional regulator [Winslowiella arboricola]MCU5775473.1 PadR family transcriptional regulator [Winslowiella arboricola]MCU5779677.1 PadR family transcriptional regulator [Winslowiella arboricola]
MSHHAHSHREPRPPRQRLFAHGDLRLLVLDILSHNGSHGYELIKAIEALTFGHYTPSPGVIYPTLDFLREQNFITVNEGEQGRKEIAITDNGRFWLDEQHAALQQIKQRIKARTVGHELRKNPAMKQALDQLKGMLDQKVNRENASDRTLEQIITILNRAAEEIAMLESEKLSDE